MNMLKVFLICCIFMGSAWAAKDTQRDCRPLGDCFKTACDSLGAFECDDLSEIQQVKNACRRVRGDECLKTSMKYLSVIDYNDLEEMVELAKSCEGYVTSECITYTCDKLGSISCNDLDEIVAVNRSCQLR